jgi:hypothetical protein
MKKNLLKGSIVLLLAVICAISCKKEAEPVVSNQPSNQPPNQLYDSTQNNEVLAIPYPTTIPPECDYAPDYGDSIVFTQPSGSGDVYANPVNNQGIEGTYLSWPDGLVMNANTGSINLTKSQTGQRYDIAFVKNGTTDTCLSSLIVGGAAYMDSVYVLSESNITAKPYFNANPYGPPVCAGTQGQGCKFDYNNFAHDQGIEVDQNTGYIDLQKTMQQSLFGILPINGTTVYTTIYYQLNDASNFASQSIQLEMIFYNHKSDIPAGLLATVTNRLWNTLTDLLISRKSATRPPLIIIVRSN